VDYSHPGGYNVDVGIVNIYDKNQE